jgi:hypothetical protein
MENKPISYRWGKVKNGLPYVANISLLVTQKDDLVENEITFLPSSNLQNTYSDWCQGIENGLKYALSKVQDKYSIQICDFLGTDVDTNATIAGYAAMRCFWESVGFVCDATEIIELESFVFQSWGDNAYLIPDFFTQTFDTQQKI